MAPGKKFFEWGNGPEGEMWERILTDTDGPYLELMAGAFSDNQPDYSWIQPDEVKNVEAVLVPHPRPRRLQERQHRSGRESRTP